MAHRPSKRTRTRDAGTGQIVPASEAVARPKETITEAVGKDSVSSVAARLAILEQVLAEAGGAITAIYERLSKEQS